MALHGIRLLHYVAEIQIKLVVVSVYVVRDGLESLVNFFVVKMRANVFEEKLEELEGVLRALGLEVVLQLLQVRSDLTQHH